MTRLFNALQFVLIAIVIIPIVILPLSVTLRLGNFLGNLTYFIWKSRRRIAIENVTKTIQLGYLPKSFSPEKIAKESFKHLGRSIIEIIKIYFYKSKEIMESVTITGLENYHKALTYDKGVLIVTAHYGNWELSALKFSQEISRVHVVARRLNNIYLNSLVERVRMRFGNSVIYKKGALKAIISHLKNQGIIGMLFDQSVLANEGALVDFLGRKAWTMKMPVILAQKTGAPLLPVFMRRTGNGHTMDIHPPFLPDKKSELHVHLQKLNTYLEEYIRDDPTQWLWIHRRWKRTTGGEHEGD